MSNAISRTPLNTWHVEHGARMVDFAGWSMPMQYTSIVAEHQATRRAAGVFDVSHMGRLRIEGRDAASWLDRLSSRRVSDLRPGRIRYGLITNPLGGVLDDVLIYHLETPGQRRYFLMVVNASNREKLADWFHRHRTSSEDVSLRDCTRDTAMISVQGPQAEPTLRPLFQKDLDGMGYYRGLVTDLQGRTCTVSRTGYTGEDGFELIVRAEDAQDVWNQVFRSGRDRGIVAAGLGARDTLRLEAGMPLYGHELSEQLTPVQAGLDFAIDVEDREFIGRDALRAAKADPRLPARVGIELSGRRVPREGYPVLAGNSRVGHVTSGTYAPTLGKPIAMAYVDPAHADPGTSLAVEIRGAAVPATVVSLPFYRRRR